ncbi:putative toxin-antitoxin system toxin component, PIN family [Lysobacter auxotrophicus]|uniref:putative toxin-antitoxin system toxin component, PIN family n=1 Tax=Lysobacter auxotrophicus TaxID=2992573 RepID=UPI0024910EF3|nr:putative toxin-antitoxin system toxin component, PIN family [Lysobacter auxotrophicus]
MVSDPRERDASPRIVLDTNVCLDLFVFRDPSVATLRDALASNAVVGTTSDECRAEWQRVLAYPVLRLDEAARAERLREYDAAMHVFDDTRPLDVVLPRCADPDDQMFLELAARCGARWLLSRDDALLQLARRTKREGWFEILTPRQWVESHIARRHSGEGRNPGP